MSAGRTHAVSQGVKLSNPCSPAQGSASVLGRTTYDPWRRSAPLRPQTVTSPAPLVLIVEDDWTIAEVQLSYLQRAGLRAEHLQRGDQVEAWVRATPPDLVVLDLMLPGMDGMEVCRALRQFSQVPIIMVTARSDDADRLRGFDQGADDYLCKPFNPHELVARVQAVLRRQQRTPQQAPEPRVIEVDAARQRVSCLGQLLDLTPQEFRLLSVLAGQPGRVFSRAQLLERAYDDPSNVFDRAVDSHIKNLRKKLAAAAPAHSFIHSVYGQGYRYEVSTADDAAAKSAPKGLPAAATQADAPVSVSAELKERLPHFIASRQALLRDLADAAARDDRAQVQHLAHRLAGSFSLYGYHWAAQRCLRIELEAESAVADGIVADVQAMQQHLLQATVRFDDQPPGTR